MTQQQDNPPATEAPKGKGARIMKAIFIAALLLFVIGFIAALLVTISSLSA